MPRFLFLTFVLAFFGFSEIGTFAQGVNPETTESFVLNERLEIQRALEQASQEYAVPLPLLQAIAYEASRWQHILPRYPEEFLLRYGVMGLSELDWFGNDLGLAAEALELEPQSLKYNLNANVRAAALGLNKFSAQQEGIALDSLQSWRPVLERYSNDQTSDLQTAYADTIFKILTRGIDEAGILISAQPELAGFVPSQLPTQFAQYSEASWFGPLPSGNYQLGRDGETIDLIILHTLEVSLLTAISWFRNPEAQASSHYLIDTRGQVYQLLEEENTAYAAGNINYNHRALHIELEGNAGRPSQDWQTPEQKESLLNLINWLGQKYAIPLDRQHILGHNQIPTLGGRCGEGFWGGCSNHYDPGAFLNMTDLLTRLGHAPEHRAVRLKMDCDVRTLPFADAPPITTLSAESAFVAYDQQDGFYLVYLTALEDPQPHLEVAGTYHWDGWLAEECAEVIDGVQLELKGSFPYLAHIRAAPSSDAEVLVNSIDGKRLVATGQTRPDSDDAERFWYEVFLSSGQKGWVRDDMVFKHD